MTKLRSVHKLFLFGCGLFLCVACGDSIRGQGDAGGHTDSGSVPTPVSVFLMAGQSNMEGYGPLVDADRGDWPLSGSLAALISS